MKIGQINNQSGNLLSMTAKVILLTNSDNDNSFESDRLSNNVQLQSLQSYELYTLVTEGINTKASQCWAEILRHHLSKGYIGCINSKDLLSILRV